jgi:hypothetical protein
MAKEKLNKKSGKTTVETAKFVAIAQKLGLTMEAKAGWINMYVQTPGTEKRPTQRLLVHTGKKGTNCIELVGYEHDMAIKHPCPPAKTMTQMLDCNLEEGEIKRAFYGVAKELVKLAKEAAEAAAKVEAPAEKVEEPVVEQATA